MADLADAPRTTEHAGRRHRKPAFVQRYWAFLSYSHSDEATAVWLQQQLEGFHVPKRLVGLGTPYGLIPQRLSPIFRDRHELAAGGSLKSEIADALAASRFLIVLCSPAAAASRWVDEEVRLFKQLRQEGEVLAAIVDGEPFGQGGEECFPPSLKVEIDGAGRPTGEPAEPIAADLRPGRDGRQGGLIKIVAGMLDVGLDELVQREHHRRQRRLIALSVASIVGMVAATGLAVTAIDARDAARDERREAEGLIGFMLGDLKDRLEPIGRLDALDAVGARALAYYEKQDRVALSDESLVQRAKALTLMGEMATSRGDLVGALARYRQAAQSTAELISRNPDDPELLFDHAQSVFWIGDALLKRGDVAGAERHLREYKTLADRMVALRPGETRYRKEGIYADSNLGVLLLEQDRSADALPLFGYAVAASELLSASAPQDDGLRQALIEALAWQAEAAERSGRLETAVALRRRQVALAGAMVARPRGDVEYLRQRAFGLTRLANLLLMQGRPADAEQHLRQALYDHRLLAKTEADNVDWSLNDANARLRLASILLLRGEIAPAEALVKAGCALIERFHRLDPGVQEVRVHDRTACLQGQARLAAASGDAAGGSRLATQAAALLRQELTARSMPDIRFRYAQAETLRGVLLAASGETAAAAAAFRAAAASAPPDAGYPVRAAARSLFLQGSGQSGPARESAALLARQGYSDPWLLRDRQALARAGMPI